MSSHLRRFLHRRVAVGSILRIGVALLAGLALGCSEPPTTTAFEPPDPQFAKPDCSVDPSHPSCGNDGGGDDGGDGTALQLDLVDLLGVAAVYPDGKGVYPSTMLDDAGGLHPPCSTDPSLHREIELRHVQTGDENIIPQTQIDDILKYQSRCNAGTSGDDRVFLKAPDMLLLTENCEGGNDGKDSTTGDCPFFTYPSYEWKGNRIKPTGGFSEVARHIEVDLQTGNLLTWAFQDPKVTVTPDENGNLTWRFEASGIHLYGLGDLCVANVDFNGDGDFLDGVDADNDQDGFPEGCLNFALSADFTIEPEGS